MCTSRCATCAPLDVQKFHFPLYKNTHLRIRIFKNTQWFCLRTNFIQIGTPKKLKKRTTSQQARQVKTKRQSRYNIENDDVTAHTLKRPDYPRNQWPSGSHTHWDHDHQSDHGSWSGKVKSDFASDWMVKIIFRDCPKKRPLQALLVSHGTSPI